MAERAVPRAFVCLLIALAIVPAAAAEPTRKKSIWGPIERNGVSQFPIYRELGVGIIQTAVALEHSRSQPAPRSPPIPPTRRTSGPPRSIWLSRRALATACRSRYC